MVTLFSQEKVSEIHDYNIAKDARAEGEVKGRREERLENLRLLMETVGFSAVQALDALRIAEEERPAYLELLAGP